MTPEYFIVELFGNKADDDWVLIWLKAGDTKVSQWGQDLSDLDLSLLPRGDVYVGCGLSPRDWGPNRRCPMNQITAIPGLWLDLDVAGAGHQKSALPPTVDDALALLGGIPLQPTIITHTGNGVHCWWLFKELWYFDDADERDEAAALERRLQHTVRKAAEARGWTVDYTADLARVLRIPGTKNYKSDPPKDVTVLDSDVTRRFNPGDFDEFLLEDPGPPSTVTTEDKAVIAGGILLDPQADPPWEKLLALGAAEPQFLESWEYNREDFKDTSPSSYDMSLANYAAMAKWTDQEIANLIIAARRKHGADVNKALRKDYMAATIARAKGDGIQAKANERLATYSAVRGTEMAEEQLEDLRLSIGELLGLEITKVIKYTSSPPEYRLETALGSIHLGPVGQLIGQLPLRRHIAAATGRLIPTFKPVQWGEIVQGLLDLCILEDTGEETTDEGRITAWLADYLDVHSPSEEIQGTRPFRRSLDDTDHVCIYLDDLRKWLMVKRQEVLTANKLGQLLRLTDFAPRKIRVTDAMGTTRPKNLWVREISDE